MTGKVFSSRYQINDRIGIGGMAEVYRAQDTVLGRLVAVKVMLPQYAADPEFVVRFRQEAAAAANLQSPYIVNVYDWGQEGDTSFIVMEYVHGSDLKTAIQQRGAINPRKVAEIGMQVCQALSVAHSQDIIHRDIKPQNIMVQPDGNIKVMDFGIARAKNSMMAHTSAVLGTAHYISPEQAQGKDLSAASDIYSLGIVLYEAVTGKLPFDGPDAVSVALKQVNELPPLPSEVHPDIDINLENIIMTALEKDPSRRFATVNDMRLALNNYLSGRPQAMGAVPGGVGMAGAPTSVMGVVPGAAIPVIDGTQMMPSVAAASPVTYGSLSAAQTYRANSTGSRQRKAPVAIIVALILAIVAVGAALFLFTDIFGKEVPNVTGMTLEKATETLKNKGFALGSVKDTYDSNVQEGLIISQDPVGGNKAAEGYKINLVVSQGAEKVTVPDLYNKTVDQATQLAELAGLTLKPMPGGYSDKVEVNHIMSQNPKANSTTTKGSTIEYVVSLGTETVTVSNVVGQSADSAQKTLQDLGLEVQVTKEVSSSVKKGFVMSQNPISGTKVEKGTKITIQVSDGPKQNWVPNVVNQTKSSAITALEAEGFEVQEEYETSTTVDAGKVIRQNPNSGTWANVGSTVIIVISKQGSSSSSASSSANRYN